MVKSLTGMAALAALTVAMPAKAEAQMKMQTPKHVEASVTGTVIDVSCKFGQGLTGVKEHRMCAQVCADKGIPLAILGDDGVLYIPTSAGMPGDGQNDRLKEFAEEKVTISGKVFEAGGAKAIQIDNIKKA